MVKKFFECETIDPGNPSSDRITVKFPFSLIERWKHKEITQFYNVATAKKVLDEPKRIFYGTRALSEGWWCYVGKPDIWYIRESVTSTFPSNKVFAVLLDADFEVYGFRSEPAAEDDPLAPNGWRERYGRLIWKSLD